MNIGLTRLELLKLHSNCHGGLYVAGDTKFCDQGFCKCLLRKRNRPQSQITRKPDMGTCSFKSLPGFSHRLFSPVESMYVDYNHHCDSPLFHQAHNARVSSTLFEPKTFHTLHHMLVPRAQCLLQAVEASTESDNHTEKRAANLAFARATRPNSSVFHG